MRHQLELQEEILSSWSISQHLFSHIFDASLSLFVHASLLPLFQACFILFWYLFIAFPIKSIIMFLRYTFFQWNLYDFLIFENPFSFTFLASIYLIHLKSLSTAILTMGLLLGVNPGSNLNQFLYNLFPFTSSANLGILSSFTRALITNPHTRMLDFNHLSFIDILKGHLQLTDFAFRLFWTFLLFQFWYPLSWFPLIPKRPLSRSPNPSYDPPPFFTPSIPYLS